VAAVALAKVSDAFETVLKSVVDPVMEVVCTIVPVFDVLGEVLKLSFSVLSKVYDAFNSVMDVVFTIVPIFDVLFAAIHVAYKLAVLLVAELCKAVKYLLNAIVEAVMSFLKKLFAPVLKAFAVIKFVFYTFPLWFWSLVR
jgi:phage-related protein